MRKQIIMMLGLSICLLLGACGNSGSAVPSDTQEPAAAVGEADANDGTIYSSDRIRNDEMQMDVVYSLCIVNDSDAVFYEYDYYDEGRETRYSIPGTYTAGDGLYEFVYDVFGMIEGKVIYLQGDVITDVQYFDGTTSTKEIAGTYSATTDELGAVTLTVGDYGKATLGLEDGSELTGNIFLFMDEWDLMVSETTNAETGEGIYLDWIMTFDSQQNTFSYRPFAGNYTTDYDGVYTCYGDIGEIEITVENGQAAAYITYNEMILNMTGDVSAPGAYQDDQVVCHVYLSDESGLYSMSIDLYDNGDGTYSYGGNMTIPLALG